MLVVLRRGWELGAQRRGEGGIAKFSEDAVNWGKQARHGVLGVEKGRHLSVDENDRIKQSTVVQSKPK